MDFVNYERKLVIELDGGQHSVYKEKDKERDEWLKSQGYEVLRFWDNEILKNKEVVLEIVRGKLLTPHPNPLPQRERIKTDYQAALVTEIATPSTPSRIFDSAGNPGSPQNL